MLTFHKTYSQPLPNWLGSWSINSNSQVLQLRKNKLNKLVQIKDDVYICCCASIYNLESRWWFQTFSIFMPKIGEDAHFDYGSTTNQLWLSLHGTNEPIESEGHQSGHWAFAACRAAKDGGWFEAWETETKGWTFGCEFDEGWWCHKVRFQETLKA